MRKKYKTTKTQKKADRYIRAAKGQIRTKAEKRVRSQYENLIRNLKRQLRKLERENQMFRIELTQISEKAI